MPETPETPGSPDATRPVRLLIAGGGTGGHLFPGVAVAEELRAQAPGAEVLFVGSRRGIEARVLPRLGWEHTFIEVSGLKTVGALGAVRGLLRIPGALWQSRAVLRRFRPDAVLGVGGYASGPVVLMARLMRVPTAILEQNSVPGLANRILGRVVRRVFLAFEEARRHFAARKIEMTGNPIRRDILAALQAGAQAGQAGQLAPPTGGPRGASDGSSGPRGQEGGAAGDAPGDPASKLNLFVFCGSQGAVAVNELVVAAAALLRARGVPVRIVHQTGERGLDDTRRRYAEAGIDADVRAFVDDMAAEYRRADLVIARAGAGTVSELTVAGVPAILIPYPHAADNHQEVNARELVAAGAARMFRQADLTADHLADAIAELAADPDARARMGSAMNALRKPDAGAAIAAWCRAQARAAP